MRQDLVDSAAGHHVAAQEKRHFGRLGRGSLGCSRHDLRIAGPRVEDVRHGAEQHCTRALEKTAPIRDARLC
jgi:hypothetical protein